MCVRGIAGRPCSGLRKNTDGNKLALGHHRDDAIESLLMSMMFNGTIASMPPKLAMFDRTFTLIRPFIYLTDEETTRYAPTGILKSRKRIVLMNERRTVMP